MREDAGGISLRRRFYRALKWETSGEKDSLGGGGRACGNSARGQAHAATMPITFSGPGVSGSLEITFGPGTDAKYSNAFEITGVSGTFSDTNNGLDIGPKVISSDPLTPGPLNVMGMVAACA
jgi:hypothetical protein